MSPDHTTAIPSLFIGIICDSIVYADTRARIACLGRRQGSLFEGARAKLISIICQRIIYVVCVCVWIFGTIRVRNAARRYEMCVSTFCWARISCASLHKSQRRSEFMVRIFGNRCAEGKKIYWNSSCWAGALNGGNDKVHSWFSKLLFFCWYGLLIFRYCFGQSE